MGGVYFSDHVGTIAHPEIEAVFCEERGREPLGSIWSADNWNKTVHFRMYPRFTMEPKSLGFLPFVKVYILGAAIKFLKWKWLLVVVMHLPFLPMVFMKKGELRFATIWIPILAFAFWLFGLILLAIRFG